MAVIKRKFDFSAKRSAERALRQKFPEELDQVIVGLVCTEVVRRASARLGNTYTVMGGFSPAEQLICQAQQVLQELDESGKLAEMYDSFVSSEKSSSGDPAENELEDAYHLADSLQMTGSDKQKKWAKSIAVDHSRVIASLRTPFEKLPKSADWWIDNRENIEEALKPYA